MVLYLLRGEGLVFVERGFGCLEFLLHLGHLGLQLTEAFNGELGLAVELLEAPLRQAPAQALVGVLGSRVREVRQA